MSRERLALILLGVLSMTAHAHDLHIFLASEGRTLVGRVTYAGGGPATSAQVSVESAEGEVLAEMPVDGQGAFRFEAGRPRDLVVRVRTPDLHAAVAVMRRSDWADERPSASDAPSVERSSTAELAKEVRLLREQVDRLENGVGIRDVVGGIGFVVGILGVLALVRQRRT
jgi:nickel transport protein